MRRPARTLLLVFGILALAALPAVRAAETAAEDEVAQILDRLRTPSVEQMWTAQRQLEQLGEDALPVLRTRLAEADAPRQIVLAKTLCSLGHAADAIEPLARLIRSKEAGDYAAVAAQVLGEPPANNLQATEDALLGLVEDRELAPPVRRAVARSLGLAASTLESVKQANATLRRLLAEAADPTAREACAVALAEIDDYDPPVEAILEELQDEPTARGQLAGALLQVNKLRTLLIRPEGRDNAGINDRLLNEIRQLMQRFHVEPPRPTHELINAAAKGMVSAVREGDHPDRHSSYFDEEDWAKFRESLSGHYGGIGAVVRFAKHFDTGEVPVFTVARPNYHGPAYEAGIRSYERIVAIEGDSTAIEKAEEAQKKLEEIVKNLRGKPGTEVTLTVTRPGSKERRTVQVERADIDLPSVLPKMLPGPIGYVRLTSFRQRSAADLEKALRELEGDGMRALIFDLRNNPGGQLSTAVEVADKFLKDDKLIVYTQGRNPRIAKREEFRTKDPTTHPDYPMVVLVNGHSASASEIVSGALQEHGRAVLVGTTTFGKGSVQKLFRLHDTAGRSGLKLTIAKYYLPSGRSIHGEGVEPDKTVEFKGTYNRDEFEQLRENGAFYRYSSTRFNAHRDKFFELAEFDALDPKRYPGFDQWHQGLADEIGRDKARRLLRAWLRILVADERGREFICDVEEDNQLQAAILEVAKRVPEVDPRQIAQYRFFAPKPGEKVAERTADE
jgi:carboxyl-terminal processing protease